jgi:hypothetical protein
MLIMRFITLFIVYDHVIKNHSFITSHFYCTIYYLLFMYRIISESDKLVQ